MAKIRDYGIYRLPGIERPLYLVPTGQNQYFLYDCEFGAQLPPRFQISDNGHIVNWFGDFPVWTLEDLIDTGKNYEE